MSEHPPATAPHYGSAVRMAHLIHWLHTQPLGIGLRDARERLGISERTLTRYIHTLKEAFIADDGHPLIEVTRPGHQGRLRFRRRPIKIAGNALELVGLFMALELMSFLDGTLFRQGAQDVLDRFHGLLQRTHAHATTVILKDFRRKFFHWNEAPKDYSKNSAIIESLVDALVYQRYIEIDYQAIGKPARRHHLAPLSLLMYKRGLYLIARKTDRMERGELTFAVERIQAVQMGEKGFAYPSNYAPQQRFEHGFGLIHHKELETVDIHFDAVVARNVTSRRWHASQQFSTQPDGSTILTMQVQVGTELMSWIQSFGYHARVLAPHHLVIEIGSKLRRALAQYDEDDE